MYTEQFGSQFCTHNLEPAPRTQHHEPGTADLPKPIQVFTFWPRRAFKVGRNFYLPVRPADTTQSAGSPNTAQNRDPTR
jgi:hypothetical protein